MDGNLFQFEPAKDAAQLNPLVLAYMGDAVFEVLVRQYVISRPNHRPNHLHREAVKFVSAKAQARTLQLWQPHLTPEEADIVKRGRNAKSGTMPKNADVLDYRHSTGFECLIGFLYYTKRFDRLELLFGLMLEQPGGS
ncbi:Mini-ribonuclease 3 [Paenibacillus flagellatus]|uniref:Mini-ribonuclease 3 n=1 Tax=Paenibacillus flagellatus TaxID=2211139 RepID=A0A2V5JUB9_9BACL|nr:Mini-ribonuclease 3 [Paenibacillus flagellatus]PYI50159.1 ribonuclease III [Paenibacillus flagellatus]